MSYILKTATLNDVEDIYNIMDHTWNAGTLKTDAGLEEQHRLFRLLHSQTKIRLEIMNNHLKYLLIKQENITIAFASYASTGIHTRGLKVHKMFAEPGERVSYYQKLLLDHIEKIALAHGITHLLLGKGMLGDFSMLGFEKQVSTAPGITNDELIKLL
jgi:hypothetical protein